MTGHIIFGAVCALPIWKHEKSSFYPVHSSAARPGATREAMGMQIREKIRQITMDDKGLTELWTSGWFGGGLGLRPRVKDCCIFPHWGMTTCRFVSVGASD